MKRRKVYVVETYLASHRKWYVWTACTIREVAWRRAREARRQYPGHKFRTVTYYSPEGA